MPAGCWREKKIVVLERTASLPDRCFKCGEPAQGYRRKIGLAVTRPGDEVLMGVAAYLFAQRGSVEVPLCEKHRRSRAGTIALVSLAALVASVIVFTRFRATDVVVPLLATAALIGGVIGLIYGAYGLLGTRVARATAMTGTHVWLKGAGQPFLASLPEAPPGR